MTSDRSNFQLKLRLQDLELILDVWDQADGGGKSARLVGNPAMVIRCRDILAKTFGRFAPGFTSWLVETEVNKAIPSSVPAPGNPIVTDLGWMRFEFTDSHAIVTMTNLTLEQIDTWFKPFAVA